MDQTDLQIGSSLERKSLMSITLPRNFAPVGLDGSDEPRTPDQTFAELKLPPPPHHSTLRIRRPRINMGDFQAYNNALPATLFASDISIPSSVIARHEERETPLPSTAYAFDVPLPSIEIPPPPTQVRPAYHHSITDPLPMERLRLPSHSEHLPRTPPAQVKPAAQSEFKLCAWDMERSSSVSSVRSDSSFSSCDTFTSRPTSFGGSVTSPDTDDPFSPHKFNVIPATPSRRSKKLRLNNLPPKHTLTWTIEMDNHLFNVYQMYLGDPTVTPFKTVPGSIPPTGVCHRVARRARTTWRKASRIPTPIVKRYRFRDVLDDRNAVVRDKTPEPNDFMKVRHDSPDDSNEGRSRWPSESATRKRLKLLCKQKFTISAHYQRLRESRSPSPFAEQFTRRPSARITRSMSRQMDLQTTTSQLSREFTAPPELRSPTVYATRELGISLVASGATAPLAQLVTGDSPELPGPMSDEWFNTPVTTSSEDKMNISPPSGLGIDPNSLAPASSIPRLASPFNYSTWNGPTRSTRGHRRELSQNQFDTVHATGSRLLSPFRAEPDVSNNANKRRAMHNLEDELSPNGSTIEQKKQTQELVFTGVGDISQRRIRLRNRGATLGATTNQERLDRLFSPPPTLTQPQQTDALPRPLGNLALAPPELDDRQKRLGSPFELDPNKRSNRSRTPRHVPSLSDPFVTSNPFLSATATASSSSVQSIGERLAQFQAMHQGGMFDAA